MAAPPPYEAATNDNKGYPQYPVNPNMAYPPMQNPPYPADSNAAYPPTQNPPYPADSNVAYQSPASPPYPPPSDESTGLGVKSTDQFYGIVSFDNKTVRLGEIHFDGELILNYFSLSRIKNLSILK